MKARAIALTLALAVLASACGSPTDDDLARAEKLVASGQWTNARSALGQVVKAQPRHDKARALLVYCLDQEGTLEEITDANLYGLFQLTQLPTRRDWDRVPKPERDVIDSELVSARKALFDKAIDTADIDDLARVLRSAAAYAVAHEKDLERKARALAIVAQSGDPTPIVELVQRLKGQDVSPTIALLTDIGEPALPALRTAIADRGFLGRAAALQTIAQIVANRRAAELVAERPTLLALPSKAEGTELLPRSVVSIAANPSAHRVHAQYAMLGDEVVVLAQAWDDTRNQVIHDVSALRGDALLPLALVDEQGKRVDLAGPSVLALATASERFVIARKLTTTSEVEIEAGPAYRPTPGMRVRLVGHAVHGAVIREDGGLWVVGVDQPIDGMSELTVAPDALKRLVKTTTTRTVKQRHHATLDGSSLVIVKIDNEDWKETQ